MALERRGVFAGCRRGGAVKVNVRAAMAAVPVFPLAGAPTGIPAPESTSNTGRTAESFSGFEESVRLRLSNGDHRCASRDMRLAKIEADQHVRCFNCAKLFVYKFIF